MQGIAHPLPKAQVGGIYPRLGFGKEKRMPVAVAYGYRSPLLHGKGAVIENRGGTVQVYNLLLGIAVQAPVHGKLAYALGHAQVHFIGAGAAQQQRLKP